MNPHVKSVSPRGDYQLEIVFENGECRRFDIRPYLDRGIFVRLREGALFDRARVVAGSVEWPGGLDLSYDTLYVEGQPMVGPGRAEHLSGLPPDAHKDARGWRLALAWGRVPAIVVDRPVSWYRSNRWWTEAHAYRTARRAVPVLLLRQ